MSRVGHGALFLIGFLALAAFDAACAQDNLEAGKKPAQMFANDCGACHKSPVGLSKAPGIFGLESFLREHYTASRQAASAIAAYIRSVDAAQPPPRPAAKRRKNESSPKAADKPGQPGEKKAGGAKPADAKPADVKPAEAKPVEAKSADPKPIDPKPAETKTDAKASSEKPAESKPADPPAASAPPAAKPEKSD